MEHKLEDHKGGCKKEPGTCHICDGGLAFCTVCRCGECELTTCCPGYVPPPFMRRAVCEGEMDYVLGVWFEGDRPQLGLERMLK